MDDQNSTVIKPELKEAKEAPKIDAVQNILDSFGKYHLGICFLLILPRYMISEYQMSITFLAPQTIFVCGDSGNSTCPCDNPIYDTSVFTNTIAMRWNLICGRSWLISLNQTMFQWGTLLGCVVLGMLSDRYGRKCPLLLSVIMQLIAGIAAAVVPDMWMFIVCRFIIGFAVGGFLVTTFVVIIEFLAPQHRDLAACQMQAVYNLGYMSLPLSAYFVRDYAVLELVITAPTLTLLSYFVFMPESPRWLMAAGKSKETVKLLERVAKVNNRSTEGLAESVDLHCAVIQKQAAPQATVLDLFRMPNIRKNTILVSFMFFTESFCFFGLSQYIGRIGGNVFLNVAATGTLCFLGSFCVIPLMKFVSRRHIFMSMNFLCAVCLALLALFPSGQALVFLACIGTVLSMLSFLVLYTYCAELYPTVIRNAALGFTVMMSRVGTLIAPFVSDLQVFGEWVPPLVFGVLPLAVTFVSYHLPETKNCKLMTTVEEVENFVRK